MPFSNTGLTTLRNVLTMANSSSPSPVAAPAAAGPATPSTKTLPTLPDCNASPSTTPKQPPKPNPSPFQANIKRDPTLSSLPHHLPFSSLAFAELHRRRRASTANLTPQTTQATPPIPPLSPSSISISPRTTKVKTRPTSPTPPPLPPKHEMLQFPDGTRVRAASISAPFAATASVPGFTSEGVAPWEGAPGGAKRSSKRVSFLTKIVRGKVLKRVTTGGSFAGAGSGLGRAELGQGIAVGRRLRGGRRRKGAGVLFFEPGLSDCNGDAMGSPGVGDAEGAGEDEPMSPSGEGYGADDEGEGEGVVRYAEEAIFRKPVVVQFSAMVPKVTMKEVLEAEPPEREPDLWLEVGREERIRGRIPGVDQVELDEGYDAVAAEEALERRLEEDLAKEREMKGALVEDMNGAKEPCQKEGARRHDLNVQAGEPWSDVVYNGTIMDERVNRTEETEETEERPGSAMSELDTLVRHSLSIGLGVGVGEESPIRMGKKRKVSFTQLANVDVSRVHRRSKEVGPSTPYPFAGQEEDAKDDVDGEEESFDSKVKVKVTPDQWEMGMFSGRPSAMEGDKARKILGLVEADAMGSLD